MYASYQDLPGAKFSDFDKELLLRDVRGVEPVWMEQFNNSPDISIILDEDNMFPYFRGLEENGVYYNLYNELPINSGRIFYSDHPMGWVKYFSHCGNPAVNEGGYCGSPFGVMLHDGTRKILRGPWSSRGAVVNMAVHENPDLQVMDLAAAGSYNIGTAMKLPAVVFLLKHFRAPFCLVRERTASKEEQGPWTISELPDKMVKPGGKSYTRSSAFDWIECAYQPE